ncbi:MAG: ABC transporter permease [Gammaproteobacteria bacterium]|nr:ABC transporter permease [Gammaproteobacteria bacterium]
MIRTILTVMAKELRETLRDRRTFISSIVTGPLLVPLFFSGAMSLSLKQNLGKIDEEIRITVVGERNAPNLVQYLREHGMDVTLRQGDADKAREWIASGAESAVLVIPDAFGERFRASDPARVLLFADGADNEADKRADRTRRLLQNYGGMIGAMRLQVRGVSPLVAQAVVVEDVDVSTPSGRATLILGMLSYIILLVMLMGGLYLAIDATAGERERGSLESLLTAPVPREHLIYGKVAGAAALMSLALALVCLTTSQALGIVPLEQIGMSANFGPDVVAKVFITVLPFTLVGASAMTIVASFTRSYKEAQTWLGIMMLVPTLPIAIAGVLNVKPTLAWMAVPSMSQHLVIQGLLKAEPLPATYLAVSMASTLALGVALAWVAGRLYRREGLMG